MTFKPGDKVVPKKGVWVYGKSPFTRDFYVVSDSYFLADANGNTWNMCSSVSDFFTLYEEPDPFAVQTIEETIKLTKYKVGDKVFESSYEANIESLFQKTKQYIETNKTGKATTDEVLMKLIYWNRHDRNA
jgi:hypothetical protein